MACLTREKGRYYRLHWKFTVSAGPQAGKLMEGSQYLGRCTRAAAKPRLRELESWEEAVKAGRHLPDGDWEGVYELWLREKALSYTPQTVLRARRVLTLYVRQRKAKKLPCLQIKRPRLGESETPEGRSHGWRDGRSTGWP